ncbi:unnamed protein product [Mytilus coruscus]|uniref:PHD-type domain-containing protein n=1 Tax=Mytilus coruscus TaxID=42192 RepID=A0A6J8BU53_MYTCO|nr:unnamed protein product [Mytilus coruscus]
MTNTDNSWDNLLMILCSICAKSVNGLVTPTYFCCRCEQTMHAHCEKDRVANVEDMNNDYICFTCTQMDQTMSNSQENNRAETTVNHTAAKNRAACTGETATIVSEEDTILKIPIKQKPKKPNKTKDVSSQERQLEGQLVQCKARIAMLEDVNRDYKKTPSIYSDHN